MDTKLSWHLEKRLIKDLSKYAKNPRFLKDRDAVHLRTCISKFGLIDKPIINLDNEIIGGHQRVNVLEKMGVEEVEVYVPNRKLGNEEVEELNIRLNKNTGDWQYEILANEFEVTDLLEWGFDSEELGLGSFSGKESEEEKEEDCEVCPTCNQKIKK